MPSIQHFRFCLKRVVLGCSSRATSAKSNGFVTPWGTVPGESLPGELAGAIQKISRRKPFGGISRRKAVINFSPQGCGKYLAAQKTFSHVNAHNNYNKRPTLIIHPLSMHNLLSLTFLISSREFCLKRMVVGEP